MILNAKTLMTLIKSNQNLYNFWEETELAVPNCLLCVYTMQEYLNITGTDRSKSHYAFCHVFSIPPNTQTNKKYGAAIVVAPDFIPSDIAHELCHLYIHGKLGYPWVWLDDNFQKRQETSQALQMGFYATRIYDSAVHPVIDQILQARLLFDPIVHDRLYNNYINELIKYLSSPLNGDKKYIFTRTIEIQNRLSEEKLANISQEFGMRRSYNNLLSQIQYLPEYPNTLTPASVYDYTLAMWNKYEVDTDLISTKLLLQTPLLVV